MATPSELEAEQAHVDRAYQRVDELRSDAEEMLRSVLDQGRGGTHQFREERDVIVRTSMARLDQLDIGEQALCFGRIDRRPFDDPSGAIESFHIGRLGVSGEDFEPLVVDWRAPVAEPFYRATGRDPMGLVLRRHLAAHGRRIVGVEDERFSVAPGDLDAADDGSGSPTGEDGSTLVGTSDDGNGLELGGPGALLAALQGARTGFMRDIVSTIQREQDEIIRSPLPGVLVVQGGPGTGKTAVALHRAAYLLYTHRFPLERQGVLVIGPNPLFLRYIEHVLPSLGESGVTLSTVSGIVSGVTARSEDPAPVARLKGEPRMAKVVARAVRTRQRALRRDAEVPFGAAVLRLLAEDSGAIVSAAKRRPGSHNSRRRFVEQMVLGKLADDFLRIRNVHGIGVNDPAPDPDDVDDGAPGVDPFEPEIDGDANYAEVIDLFGNRASGAPAAAAGNGANRPHNGSSSGNGRNGASHSAGSNHGNGAKGLSPTEDQNEDTFDLAEFSRQVRRLPQYIEALERMWPRISAEELLHDLLGAPALMGLAARGILSAPEQALLVRPRSTSLADIPWTPADLALIDEARVLLGPRRNRATGSAEPEGTLRNYGHIVVDEAQDLSPMQLRMVARRSLSGSISVVGDIAQATGPWAPNSWAEVTPHLPSQRPARLVELTVSYRTPAEVVELSAPLLAVVAPGTKPPRPVRRTGVAPLFESVGRSALAATVARVAAQLSTEVEPGTAAVLAPASLVAELALALDAAGVPAADPRRDGLGAPLTLLPVDLANGLEFDAVVVVEPAAIVEESPQGLRTLYVSLTRPTRRLAVVHARPLPDALRPR